MFDLNFINKKAKDIGENFFITGCDEVGRGPLAGPVVAASATLKIKEYDQKEIKLLLKKWQKLGITDSKKLTSNERLNLLGSLSIETLKDKLKSNQIYTHHYSKNITLTLMIKEIQASVIDEINILQASLRAMKEAFLEGAPIDLPGVVLIDGNKKFKQDSNLIELESVVKGDSLSLLIGLASIVAKEYRDQLMSDYAEKYPGYGWEQNSGYPTKKHLSAIEELGVTELHRLTFRGVKEIYAERGYSRV